ncbi:MAG: 4-demethylwyosine synthase TYW1 [Candidatus Woesearchaeota archaeon]
MIPLQMIKRLELQQYRIAGRHSAVKICHWVKKSLKGECVCYKEKFYGINCHRCMQISPAVAWCPNRCLYCWRTENPIGNDMSKVSLDDPKTIIDECIKGHKSLINGLKGHLKVAPEKWKEAWQPNQCAISLVGEPTLYPLLPQLIKELKNREFNIFLVTNGQFPEMLEKLVKENALPDQLYISLDAPDKESYKKIDIPQLKDYWERLNRSLEIMSRMTCKKAIRLTLVRGRNMHNPEGYAESVRKANPDFVEVKGFMHVGGAEKRLKEEEMPSMDEIRKFSVQLAALTGYKVKDEQEVSRVVLLVKQSIINAKCNAP